MIRRRFIALLGGAAALPIGGNLAVAFAASLGP
jgi:hypothetical protein